VVLTSLAVEGNFLFLIEALLRKYYGICISAIVILAKQCRVSRMLYQQVLFA